MDSNKNNSTRNRCFYYQSGAQDLNVSFRRTIGMHLFKMRQGRKIPVSKICTDLNLKRDTLDNIEIGKGDINWQNINKLLNYYRVRVHMTLEKNHFFDESKAPKINT